MSDFYDISVILADGTTTTMGGWAGHVLLIANPVSTSAHADTLAELWRNYDALLFDLIRPGARRYKEAPFYYSSCRVDKFIPDEPRPWLQFTLTLTFYEGSSEKSYYEL